MDLIKLTFLLLSLLVTNVFTFILLKYHSSILYLKRNILTYLNSFLVMVINALVNLQVKYLLIIVVSYCISVKYTSSALSVTLIYVFSVWKCFSVHSAWSSSSCCCIPLQSSFLLAVLSPSRMCLHNQPVQNYTGLKGIMILFVV